MKKNKPSLLSLNKKTVVTLGKAEQQLINGGQSNPTDLVTLTIYIATVRITLDITNPDSSKIHQN